MTEPTSTPRNSDALIPRYWRRLRRLAISQGFPHLITGSLVFVLAVWLGGAPDLNFGFVSSFNEPGSPVPPPTVRPTTTVVETTTTTEAPLTAADLDRLLEEIGFPDVSLEADGTSVVVTGVVPDDASKRAVLARILALEDVTDVVDELQVRSAPTAANAAVEVSLARAVVSGRVADEATADRLLGLVESVYLPSQVTIDGLEVDPTAAALDTIVVSGSVTDPEFAAQLTDLFESIDSIRSEVDISVADKPRIEVELDELLDARQLRFANGAADVSEEDDVLLDEIAAILAQFPNATVEVGGHTDGQGDEQSNLELSQARAEAVVLGLRQRGVDVELRAVGYGELRPKVQPERSAVDRAANRRIEFRLVNPE